MISIAHIAHYVFDATITYDDVAPDQRLSHGGALRLLQEAAAVASDLRGYGLKDIPRNGVAWILTGWRLELLERPAWNTAISVETWPRSMDGFISDRDFLLRSGETLVARGTSRWFLVSAATGRIARITPEVRSAYELDETRIFPGGDDIPGNGKSPADARETFSYTVGRRDIDTNHHVNNIHYLDFALEALPQEVYDHLPATVDVAFRKQILLGTPIRCLYAHLEDGRHQVEIRSGPEDAPVHHAFLWFY